MENYCCHSEGSEESNSIQVNIARHRRTVASERFRFLSCARNDIGMAALGTTVQSKCVSPVGFEHPLKLWE